MLSIDDNGGIDGVVRHHRDGATRDSFAVRSMLLNLVDGLVNKIDGWLVDYLSDRDLTANFKNS